MTVQLHSSVIKTLVDHIGGDSSSIPDGIIGGGGADTIVPFEWSFNDRHYLCCKYEETKQPLCGMVFKGYYKFSSDYQYWTCVVATSNACTLSDEVGGLIYKCNNATTETIAGKTYITVTTPFYEGDYELPDNKTTGFFIPQSNEMLSKALAGLAGALQKVTALR